MPVGEGPPLDEELPLGAALQRGLEQRVGGLSVGAGRGLGRQRGLSPGPVEDLLDLPLQRRALGSTGRGSGVDPRSALLQLGTLRF